jgi:hypothetical protein
MRRALQLVAAIMLTIFGLAPLRAEGRSIHVFYRYPAGTDLAGVALYYGASQGDVERNLNLTRIDLKLRQGRDDGVVIVTLAGLDDTRDYFVTLRAYDSQGRESANSAIGVVAARAPPEGALFADSFEAYVPGADPPGWVDSGSSVTAAGNAGLFAVSSMPNGTLAFGSTSSAADLNSTLVASGSSGWASYEYSGRVESDSLSGEAGVSVLSAYPDAQFYYRLTRSASTAWKLVKRGGTGALACSPSSSTGVTTSAGAWLRFRVRATRFDGRNRVRAMLWPDGTAAPAAYQVDCWDSEAESNASGRVGVYSSGAAGSHWDDLAVVNVAADGAPPGYGTTPPASPAPPQSSPPPTPPPPPPPPPPPGYTSESSLEHWWRPGWDASDLGRDFANGGDVDAFEDAKGLNASNLDAAGTTNASADFDGKSEALGNYDLHALGIGDNWSLAAWVRPERLAVTSKSRYVLDLNGKMSTDSVSRISLTIDSGGHFAIEVSDAQGRARQISAPAGLVLSDAGDAWYHVAAVKKGTSSLALYVNGVLVASTGVGIPSQTDAPRALRIGGMVKLSTGRFWQGSIASVALWSKALGAPEVSALYAKGNRGVELRQALAAR